MASVILNPNSDTAESADVLHGAATIWQTLEVTAERVYSSPTVVTWWARCGLTNMPAAQSVSSVKITWESQENVSDDQVNRSRGFIYVSGTKYNAPWATINDYPAWVTGTYTWTVNPYSLLPWSSPVVNELEAGIEADTSSYAPNPANTPEIRRMYVTVEYVPLTSGAGTSRDAASRRIWLRRRSGDIVTITGGLWLARFAPGDAIDLEHLAGPHETANGWGAEAWKRRPLWVETVAYNPSNMSVTLRCRDHRQKLCLLYDSGIARAAGTVLDGLMRLSPAASWTMTRASSAEFLDATSRLVSVSDNVEALAADGQVIQLADTCKTLNNSFALGIATDWTSAGTGSNGSAIAADTASLLWSPELSAQSVKFTAGNPIHAADLKITGTAAAYLANDKVNVLVYHKDSSGAPIRVALQRSIDSKYWDGDSWETGIQWNALTVSSSWARHALENIDVGASNTNLTLIVGIPTTGTAGQINYVAYAGVHSGLYSRSPIRTQAASVTRSADRYYAANNSAARVWNVNQGTVLFEVQPFFDGAEVTTTNHTVCYAYHDASNWFWLYFDAANARWVAEWRRAGSNYRAVKSAVPVAGTRYKIAARWTGSNAELDLAAYTGSIFVDGVKGTDVAIGGVITEVASSNFDIGSKAGTDQFDGYIRQRVSRQIVLSDAEIARGI